VANTAASPRRWSSVIGRGSTTFFVFAVRVLTARLAAAQAAAGRSCRLMLGERNNLRHRSHWDPRFGALLFLRRTRSPLSRLLLHLCSRLMSFCARFSSDSDQSSRPVAPAFFSTKAVNSTSFCTLLRISVSASEVNETSSMQKKKHLDRNQSGYARSLPRAFFKFHSLHNHPASDGSCTHGSAPFGGVHKSQ